ncbi:hypothetical protein HA402_002156 [Bradysia odoriphaga]|nr:hypothetical protein HA402_002156 [Bradysia odoriphaga]
MVDDLKCKIKWNCTDGQACTCSCEAKLNDIGCELDAYFDELETAGAVVLGYLTSFLEFCNEWNELAEKFVCTYRPICNESSGSGEKDINRSEKDTNRSEKEGSSEEDECGEKGKSPEKKKSGEKDISNESGEHDQCCEFGGRNLDWLAAVKAFIMKFYLDEPAQIVTNISEICDRTDEAIQDWLQRLKY